MISLWLICILVENFMIFQCIIGLTLLFSLICVFLMIKKLRQQPRQTLSPLMTVKLCCSGILAFIADTLGIGSFAVNVALARLLGTFSDDEMPAVNNGAQVIPGVIESIFFLNLVQVDWVMLVSLVASTCIGGVLGGLIVTRLNKQTIRLAMRVCFFILILLLIAHQFRLMPVGGDVEGVRDGKLIIGCLAMVLCGALTSFGIGLFLMVQAVLFLLNVTPAVAFPIMTTAGALQQPLTTMVFLQKDKIPLKKTLVLSLSGCVGVLITMPIFTHLTVSFLHSLLMLILIYNLGTISLSYWQQRQRRHASPVMTYSPGLEAVNPSE